MTPQKNLPKNELSWHDIFIFIKHGWKIITFCSLSGLIAGTLLAFSLPNKFKANALIEPASVTFRNKPGSWVDGTFTKTQIESGSELATNMLRSDFYSDSTLRACGLNISNSSKTKLINTLNPRPTSSSRVVSISYVNTSREAIKPCIESVLHEINLNQKPKIELNTKYIKDELIELERTLEKLKNDKELRQKRIQNKIDNYRLRLLEVEDIIKTNEQKVNARDISKIPTNELSTMIYKSNIAHHLETRIDELERNLTLFEREDDELIRKLTETYLQLKPAINLNNSRPAIFISPIAITSQLTLPVRALMSIAGMIIGFFAGTIIFYGLNPHSRRKPSLNL